jgi:hypothetical protein
MMVQNNSDSTSSFLLLNDRSLSDSIQRPKNEPKIKDKISSRRLINGFASHSLKSYWKNIDDPLSHYNVFNNDLKLYLLNDIFNSIQVNMRLLLFSLKNLKFCMRKNLLLDL